MRHRGPVESVIRGNVSESQRILLGEGVERRHNLDRSIGGAQRVRVMKHSNRSQVRRIPFRILPLIVIAAGCRPGGEATSAGPTVRDSAGIRIVENSEPQWADEERWTLSSEPLVTIGNRDNDPLLTQIVGANRLADGRIVVGDAGGPSIFFFSPTGELETEAGGTGDGPGEFGRLDRTWLYRGDSLITFDVRGFRVSVFSPEGEYVRSMSMEPGGSAIFAPHSSTAEGDILWTPYLFSVSATGETGWRYDTVLRTDSDAVRVDSLISLPSIYQEFDGTERVSLGFPPWGIFRTGPTRLLWARTDRPEIHRVDFDGQLVDILRWQNEPVPITSALRQEIIDELVANVREGPDDRGFYSASNGFEERRYPEFAPPIEEMIADATGAVWVKGQTLPNRDTGRIWQIFHRDGHWLGEMVLPDRLTVLEIGSDYLLGAELDEFDVPAIVLYDIVKP